MSKKSVLVWLVTLMVAVLLKQFPVEKNNQLQLSMVMWSLLFSNIEKIKLLRHRLHHKMFLFEWSVVFEFNIVTPFILIGH